MLTNPVASNHAATATGQSNATSTSGTGAFGGGMDGMFMQLLVTQLQNQDPLSPMDPSTFVSQLVEVTNLDQVTQINQLLQVALAQALTSGASSSPSAASTGGH